MQFILRPADGNGNIVVGVGQKATCTARLRPGKVKWTLADVMHVADDSDGSEADNKNNSPKNQCNPDQDPPEAIHLPFRNGHKSVFGSSLRMDSAGNIGSESRHRQV